MVTFFNKVIAKIQQLLISSLDIACYLHKKRGYNEISILTYHNIVQGKLPVNDACFLDVTLFEQHIAYLNKNFLILPLSEAFEQAQKKNTKPIAVITFDDGFYSNYSLAFPVLKKYKAPATIFLTTSMINSNKTIWFCNLVHLLSITTKEHLIWGNITFDLSNSKRKEFASKCLQQLLKRENQASLINSLSKIAQLLECELENDFDKESAYFMLTQEAIIEMLDSQIIEFGAHSHSHIILAQEKLKLAESEIIQSIKCVEKLTKRDCRYFAYPNGRPIDYNDHHVEVLRQNNINFAATTKSGLTSPYEERLAFKRIFIHSETQLPIFKLQVHGYR